MARRAPQPTDEAQHPPLSAVLRTRRADIDALRVFAIVVVFLVHCAQVFSPWQSWHVQSTQRSAWIAELTLLAWPWVMPVFMLLAGAGAWFSLGRRTDGEFFRERTLRLALPTIVGTFLLIPPQIWVERLAQGRFSGSFLSFLPHFVDGFYPEGNLSAGHLWFLAYLYVYAILTMPLLRRLRRPERRGWLERVASAVDTRWGVLLIPSTLLATTQVALRAPFPETLALVDDWANHAILLLAYVFGVLLMAHERFEKRVQEEWPTAIPFGLLGSIWISVEVWTSTEPGFLPRGYTLQYVLFWTAFSVAGWSWIVVLLGSAHRFVRGHGSALTWAAERVFLFYVIHQTVIVLVAYPVVRSGRGIALQFGITALASFALALVLTEAFGRLPATRALFGLRSR